MCVHCMQARFLGGALLGGRCVQNLNQVEFHDARLFPVLLCLNFLFLVEGQGGSFVL